MQIVSFRILIPMKECWWVFKEPGCLSTALLFCSNLKGGIGSPMVTLSCVIPGRPWHASADE